MVWIACKLDSNSLKPWPTFFNGLHDIIGSTIQKWRVFKCSPIFEQVGQVLILVGSEIFCFGRGFWGTFAHQEHYQKRQQGGGCFQWVDFCKFPSSSKYPLKTKVPVHSLRCFYCLNVYSQTSFNSWYSDKDAVGISCPSCILIQFKSGFLSTRKSMSSVFWLTSKLVSILEEA